MRASEVIPPASLTLNVRRYSKLRVKTQEALGVCDERASAPRGAAPAKANDGLCLIVQGVRAQESRLAVASAAGGQRSRHAGVRGAGLRPGVSET